MLSCASGEAARGPGVARTVPAGGRGGRSDCRGPSGSVVGSRFSSAESRHIPVEAWHGGAPHILRALSSQEARVTRWGWGPAAAPGPLCAMQGWPFVRSRDKGTPMHGLRQAGQLLTPVSSFSGHPDPVQRRAGHGGDRIHAPNAQPLRQGWAPGLRHGPWGLPAPSSRPLTPSQGHICALMRLLR